ncbi:MAG: hypothetical protein Q9207_007816, partial [Kuettlingeria erythrocarpa]
MIYKYNEVRWEPLGVLAACISWKYISPASPSDQVLHTNELTSYPFHNALSPVISTLFTGSALILKPSESTAFSSAYFISIARHALSALNHPPNLVQSLPMWPSTANHLTSHPGISHITFIGSRPVAHAVCTSAAKSLIPVCVELGGKDPAIILDSVSPPDLEHKVVPILMRGIFTSAGQNCIGIERIIACPRSYSLLIPLLERAAYSVFAVTLPSSGTVPAVPDFSLDVAAIRTAIGSTIATGKDVLLVLHSYGAVVGCEALKGIKADEAAAARAMESGEGHQLMRAGRVVKVAFIAGLLFPEGKATLPMSRGSAAMPGFECE